VCPPRDVSDRHTDVLEIGWASAVDTVKSSYGHLVKDSLAHWQPMKHITKNWGDVSKLASTDDQTGSSIQNHLQPTDDLCRHAVHEAITIVDSTGNKCDGYGASGVDWQ